MGHVFEERNEVGVKVRRDQRFVERYTGRSRRGTPIRHGILPFAVMRP
jgi:hypothetical protein